MNAAPKKRADRTWEQTERRQWWLSASSIVLSLVLTVGILSIALPLFTLESRSYDSLDKSVLVEGLLGLVLLFDLYVAFQQMQLHRIRRQTAAREELFELISENAADMIAVVNADGTRAYNSPSYERLLGYSTEELRRTVAFEQIHPDDRANVVAAANEAKRSGHGKRVEYRMRHKDGRWISLESTASVVRDDDGEVQKLVIVNRDITERKQLEHQLQTAQKVEAIGRLSGGIAHDFNNILGVIIGYTEAIQKRMRPEDAFREAIDEIEAAAKRAAALTQQLLAFGRKQVLEPKILDLNAVVREMGKMLGSLLGEHIELVLALSDSLGMVKADRTQLEQVIMNLSVNGRDAMAEGGKLTIETLKVEMEEDNVQRPAYMLPGSYVLLKVTDTGCGMTREVQAHIFEPFFTTKGKGKGTGLGLATVYGIVKQSGGYILLKSEPGKGAEFDIYLPSAGAAVEIASEPPRAAMRPQKTEATILLVEDETSLRKLTRDVLRENHYTVFEAADGSEALAVAKSMEEIDLLLTDIVMPGMSGRALADAIAKVRPETRVLFMSGYTDGQIAKQGVLDPGTVILRKPFSREELIRRVEEVLAAVTT
jgi:two-component system, cell cycle sensor histidine kinase and response regulator CckA